MLQLTQDQQNAADTFFRFLNADEAVFVLSGGAGVGKTFLMGHICNDVMKLYKDSCKLLGTKQKYNRVDFTATTNKAAEVLERSVGQFVQTIHSYLGLKVVENHRTGETNLEKTGAYSQKKNRILFIDESSMIDHDLYKIILETMVDSKVIFVGDHAQMAPVNEERSPVYDYVHPDNFVFLSQPVRNAGSPALVALCAQLRETVETGIFKPIDAVPGTIDYLNASEMQRQLGIAFQDPNPDARILCYHNQRAIDYNAYVREIRGLPVDPVHGDVLVVAQAYNRGNMSLSVEREVFIELTSDEIHDGGYGEFFTDTVGILYRKVKVRALSGACAVAEVKMPLDPERVRLVCKALAKEKNWSAYFALKSEYIDLRGKEACTVYKSQGSTYETVFIDLEDIGRSFDAAQVARMLFVAASRATTRIFFYGTLPHRYTGG